MYVAQTNLSCAASWCFLTHLWTNSGYEPMPVFRIVRSLSDSIQVKDIVSSPAITFLIPSLAKSSEMILSVSRMTEAKSANTISPRTLAPQNRNVDFQDIMISISCFSYLPTTPSRLTSTGLRTRVTVPRSPDRRISLIRNSCCWGSL